MSEVRFRSISTSIKVRTQNLLKLNKRVPQQACCNTVFAKVTDPKTTDVSYKMFFHI